MLRAFFNAARLYSTPRVRTNHHLRYSRIKYVSLSPNSNRPNDQTVSSSCCLKISWLHNWLRPRLELPDIVIVRICDIDDIVGVIRFAPRVSPALRWCASLLPARRSRRPERGFLRRMERPLIAGRSADHPL